MTDRENLGISLSQQQIRAVSGSEWEWADLESLLCLFKEHLDPLPGKANHTGVLMEHLFLKQVQAVLLTQATGEFEKAVGRDVKKANSLSVPIFATTYL